MVSTLLNEIQTSTNPIEVIEEIAAAHDWQFDRQNEDEVAVQVNQRQTRIDVRYISHCPASTPSR